MRPALSRETDLRERLGMVRIGKDADLSNGALQPYVDVCEEMKRRMVVGIFFSVFHSCVP
jgi:tRNA-dihydrouridine synthase 1